LINLYDVGSKEEELDKLVLKLNEFSKDNNKEKYNKIIKEDKFENWFYKNKFYCLKPGLYPIDEKRQKTNFSNIKKAPIIKFLMEEDIELYEEMGEDLIELYKNNTKALIFLDPPYLQSCNDFYLESRVNIYEYLSINTIDKMEATILLCLENNWIIKLLFNNFIKSSYNKKYEMTKKRTTHLIISNK
jgi:16S rRNA G966 N2-methylase RsmD